MNFENESLLNENFHLLLKFAILSTKLIFQVSKMMNGENILHRIKHKLCKFECSNTRISLLFSASCVVMPHPRTSLSRGE